MQLWPIPAPAKASPIALRNSDFRQRILYAWEKGYYRSDENKPVEHTLYGNPDLLWEALSELGQNVPPTLPSTNVFSDEAPPGGTPMQRVSTSITTGRWLTGAMIPSAAVTNAGLMARSMLTATVENRSPSPMLSLFRPFTLMMGTFANRSMPTGPVRPIQWKYSYGVQAARAYFATGSFTMSYGTAKIEAIHSHSPIVKASPFR